MGEKNGIQRYKCHVCGKQFTGGLKVSKEQLWQEFSEGKQTYSQLSKKI
jgi:transposase-like protein